MLILAVLLAMLCERSLDVSAATPSTPRAAVHGIGRSIAEPSTSIRDVKHLLRGQSRHTDPSSTVQASATSTHNPQLHPVTAPHTRFEGLKPILKQHAAQPHRLQPAVMLSASPTERSALPTATPPATLPSNQHLPTPAAKPLKITNIALLGERHSGVHYLLGLLRHHLDPSQFTITTGLTADRQYLQPPPLHPIANTLVIVSVRNAYDWALALHKLCYCCESRQQLPFSRFVSDPYYAEDSGGPTHAMCPSEDRDIFNNNQPFPNLMDMRAAKLRNHLNTRRWVDAHEVVRWEDVLTPEAASTWLQALATAYNLTTRIAATAATANKSLWASTPLLTDAVNLVDDGLLAKDSSVRPWHRKSFDPRQQQLQSVYLNWSLLSSTALNVVDEVATVNAKLTMQEEVALGYKRLEASGPGVR